MLLVETPERAEFRSSLRKALATHPVGVDQPGATVRDGDGETDLWRLVARDLDLAGLLVPEKFGGSGATAAEMAVVLEELGRVLSRVPYFSTAVLSVAAILASGDEAAMTDYLPAIASGSCVATVACAEDTGDWSPDAMTLRAEQVNGGWELTGTKHYVVDGGRSDLILVVGLAPAGVSLYAATAGATGLQITGLSTMDQTRSLARLDFDRVEARLLGTAGAGWPMIEQVLQSATIALAAEQLGGLQRTLEMSVEHAKTRVQFGVAIGTFQGVKHRCADMLIRVEAARSLVAYAAWCAATGDPDLPVASAMAYSYCSDGYFESACENIQVHGGIGFTWEHPAHLYLKRAATSRALLGTPTTRRAALADLLSL